MPVTCCEIDSPPIVGDVAAIITIRSGSPDPVSGVTIRAEVCDCGYDDEYADQFCNVTQSGTYPNALVTDTEYTIDDMPANSVLLIDASERRVTLTDSAGRVQSSDVSVLDWTGLFEWIEASKGGCVTVCIDTDGAETNSDTTAEVTYVERVL